MTFRSARTGALAHGGQPSLDRSIFEHASMIEFVLTLRAALWISSGENRGARLTKSICSGPVTAA